MTLYSEQAEALEKLKDGNILVGDVGSGKSCTGLAYYFTKVQEGKITEDLHYLPPSSLKDIPLYIITTPKKRNDEEWFDEVVRWNVPHNYAIVDSWNNIKKYKDVKNSFFIFDEQRVAGSGVWVRHFLKITKNNKWILLTATPGDKWINYLPVFMANGYFRTRSEFYNNHVVYKPYLQYPVIDRYLNTHILEKYRQKILVNMKSTHHIQKRYYDIICDFDSDYISTMLKKRIFKNEDGEWKPIENSSQLAMLCRRTINTHVSRIHALKKIFDKHKKIIVFYSYVVEKDLILAAPEFKDVLIHQHNGQKHEPVPKGPKWLYLCQYASASEAWNCTTTNCVVFYSLDHAWWRMTQAAGRIDRRNTPFYILHYYRLMSKSSTDYLILKALKEKRNFNENAFNPKDIYAPNKIEEWLDE